MPSHPAEGVAVSGMDFEQWSVRDHAESCDGAHCWHQGLQPYVNAMGYFELPFPQDHEWPVHSIDAGVDQAFSYALEPGQTMSVRTGYGMEWGQEDSSLALSRPATEGIEVRNLGQAFAETVTSATKMLEDRTAEAVMIVERNNSTEADQPQRMCVGHRAVLAQSGRGDPDLLNAGPCVTSLKSSKMRSIVECQVSPSWEEILEDDDAQLAEPTSPGLLQDRLVVLQARALPCQWSVAKTGILARLRLEFGACKPSSTP